MSRRNRGFFGRLFNEQVYMRDSRHAANIFSFNKSALNNGTPRLKFQYFVNFNFNSNPQVSSYVRNFLSIEDQNFVTALVKSVTMPNMQINTEVLNQYNKKRIVQTKLDFQPITITLHDTVEGKTLRLWEMYYEYYFREGEANRKQDLNSQGRARNNREFEDDTILNRFNDNIGYNLERVGNNKYLIDSIDIYQVHGGKFSRTEIIHPKITSFTHDTLDYADTAGLMEIRLDFQYENVLYSNVNLPLNSDELERYRDGDFWEMSNLITIRTNVPGRNLRATAPYPNVSGPSPTEDPADIGTDAAGNLLGGRLGSPILNIVGQRNISRVQDSIGGIVDSIPDAVATAASATIFGGKVSFQPNPLQALRTTANQVSRSVVSRGREAFTSAVRTGVEGVITGVRTGDETTQTPPEEDGDDD